MTTTKPKAQKLTKLKREVVETTGKAVVPSAAKLDAAVERVHSALRSGATSYW